MTEEGKKEYKAFLGGVKIAGLRVFQGSSATRIVTGREQFFSFRVPSCALHPGQRRRLVPLQALEAPFSCFVVFSAPPIR
jgi:hypothetical protein